MLRRKTGRGFYLGGLRITAPRSAQEKTENSRSNEYDLNVPMIEAYGTDAYELNFCLRAYMLMKLCQDGGTND